MQTLKMKKGKENPDLRLKQTTIQFPTQQVDNAAPVQPPVPPTTVKLEYRRKSDGELQGSIEFLIYSFDTFETLAQTIIDRPYDSQEMNYRLLGGRADAWTFVGLAFRRDDPGAVETGITGNTEEEATRALKNACRVIHRENELGNKYQYTMIAYFEEH